MLLTLLNTRADTTDVNVLVKLMWTCYGNWASM